MPHFSPDNPETLSPGPGRRPDARVWRSRNFQNNRLAAACFRATSKINPGVRILVNEERRGRGQIFVFAISDPVALPEAYHDSAGIGRVGEPMASR